MNDVQKHYRDLLAKHYVWMFGTSFEAKVAEQKAILEGIVAASTRGLAVDLGSGPGFQSIALIELGYTPVLAIDTSEELLHELRARNANVNPIQDDILHIGDWVTPESARIIVCMGDTITHLDSKETVSALLQHITTCLAPGGIFVLTYRDLSIEVKGLDRFIPVQSDDDRVMTCFLDYDSPETVAVHDLVYTRTESGWSFAKSSYRKLRLPIAWLHAQMEAAGLTVEQGSAGRLACLVGRK